MGKRSPLILLDSPFSGARAMPEHLSKPDIPHPFPEAGVAPLSTSVL